MGSRERQYNLQSYRDINTAKYRSHEKFLSEFGQSIIRPTSESRQWSKYELSKDTYPNLLKYNKEYPMVLKKILFRQKKFCKSREKAGSDRNFEQNLQRVMNFLDVFGFRRPFYTEDQNEERV